MDCTCNVCKSGGTCQNTASKLKAEAEILYKLTDAIGAFEAQREGNPQPVLLEFAWGEVIAIWEEAALCPTEPTQPTGHNDGFN